MPAPANDNYADAEVLPGDSGTVAWDNTDATAEVGEHYSQAGWTVWFEWTPSFTGNATLAATPVFAAAPDPYVEVSVYVPPYGVTDWADYTGAPPLTFPVVAGTTYHIAIDTYYSQTASGTLTYGPAGTPPANDNYVDAIELVGDSGTEAFDNTAAAAETGEVFSGSGSTVWFTWTAPSVGTVVFTTEDTPGDSDTVISVWARTVADGLPTTGPLASDDDTGNDPAVGSPVYGAARLTMDALAGQTYMIQVDTNGGGVADGVLGWAFTPNAPVPFDRVPIRRVSPTMATPLVLDSLGRPVEWQVASTVEEGWGHLRVFCGGEDVTAFRGAPTEIRSYEYVEPFGYGPASIAFPQISPFDTLGAGDLDWFVQGMNVELKREDPTTGVLTSIWEGWASTWDPESTDKGYTFAVSCAGALQQAQLEPMPPSFEGGLVDIGAAIKAAFDGVPSRRYGTFPTVVTTRGTRNRGAWQTAYDYVQEILSTAYNADGTLQWTVGCGPGRVPTLHIKDRTTVHWTVSVGTPGAILDETSDITGAANVIYGEGIDEDGGRWRNSRYPDANPPVFVPLAYVSDNMPYTYDGSGNPTANPSFDPDRLRVARYENFGTGFSKTEGVASALGELARDVNPGWYGTLTLHIDPEEGSRRDIRAGQNIALRHHHGHPTRNFHIAGVKVDHEQNTVALTVDTNARDWITLAGLMKRDREAQTDPARRLNPPRRRSRMTPDQRPVFDAESGAGLIPATALTADTWNIIRIPASRYGTIARTEMTTASSPTRFAVGVFSKEITGAEVLALVGNPITGTAWDSSESVADDLSDAGLLMAWGDTTELSGYWPLAGDGTNPVTGRLVDDGSWAFVSDTPPWLWIAIYPDAACTLTGRLYLAPETG